MRALLRRSGQHRPGRASASAGRPAALIAALGGLLLYPAAAIADGGAGQDLAQDWSSAWSLPPLKLAPIVIAGVFYGLRVRRLGRRIAPWRITCFATGLLMLALAICSPIDPVGEDGLLAVHMLQHALIGGLAPLFVALGLTGPVLRPALRLRAFRRLHALAHPVVALPLWAAVLVFWHIPPVFEVGVSNPVAHSLQHATFFTTAVLLWAPVVEPLPAPAWFGTGPKIGYLMVVWFAGVAFVNTFWFAGTVFYPRYEATAPDWGVSALQDQANAGTVFMAEHMVLVLGAVLVLAVRLAREQALRQRLIEAGVDAGSAQRAVRYGRGEALARAAGLAPGTRPGID